MKYKKLTRDALLGLAYRIMAVVLPIRQRLFSGVRKTRRTVKAWTREQARALWQKLLIQPRALFFTLGSAMFMALFGLEMSGYGTGLDTFTELTGLNSSFFLAYLGITTFLIGVREDDNAPLYACLTGILMLYGLFVGVDVIHGDIQARAVTSVIYYLLNPILIFILFRWSKIPSEYKERYNKTVNYAEIALQAVRGREGINASE